MSEEQSATWTVCSLTPPVNWIEIISQFHYLPDQCEPFFKSYQVTTYGTREFLIYPSPLYHYLLICDNWTHSPCAHLRDADEDSHTVPRNIKIHVPLGYCQENLTLKKVLLDSSTCCLQSVLSNIISDVHTSMREAAKRYLVRNIRPTKPLIYSGHWTWRFSVLENGNTRLAINIKKSLCHGPNSIWLLL